MEWLIAGILATIGALGGTINMALNQNEQQKQLEQQINQVTQEGSDDIDLMKLEYDVTKTNAEHEAKLQKEKAARLDEQALAKNSQAQLADETTTLQEKTLSDEFNLNIDKIQTQQAQSMLGYQSAQMGIDSTKGGKLAQLASSGVRAGSSAANAVELESAVNSMQLQAQQDTDRKNTELGINSLLNGLKSSQLGIRSDRIQADWLRSEANWLTQDANTTRSEADYLVNSYANGGDQWNIYQQRLKNRSDKLYNNINTLQTQLADLNNPGKNFLRYATSILSGGNSGFMSGYNFGKNLK